MLRALVALLKNLCLVPRTYTVLLKTASNFSFKAFSIQFWPLYVPTCTWAHTTHTHTHTHTQIKTICNSLKDRHLVCKSNN